MKRQIRSSVFETNSSSAHSIVMRNTNKHYDAKELREHMYINKNGEWILWQYELEFGRSPFKYLATFVDKVRFVIASICDGEDADKRFKEIEKIVKGQIPECKKIIVEEQNGFYSGFKYGYVEDDDIILPFLQEKGIDLKEFLTNKKYNIICDGDEYLVWEDMVNSGIINRNEIEGIYGFYDEEN